MPASSRRVWRVGNATVSAERRGGMVVLEFCLEPLQECLTVTLRLEDLKDAARVLNEIAEEMEQAGSNGQRGGGNRG